MNDTPNIVPGSVPEYLSKGRRLTLNANARANLTSSFAVVGYRGGRWSLKYRGDYDVLQASPGTGRDGRALPEQPVAVLDVVVCGMTPNISKSYYIKQYVEGSDDPPDCFSINGVYPDAASPAKQHSHCALCPRNRFGSHITAQGRKAKACTDYRRLAIVPALDPENESYGGPMLLRIPPMSLVNLDRYTRELERLGADISEVVTRLSFNPKASYPEIRFEATEWITPETHQAVIEWAAGEQINRMLEEAAEQATADATPETPETKSLGARPSHLQAVAQNPQRPPPPPRPVPKAEPIPTAPPKPAAKKSAFTTGAKPPVEAAAAEPPQMGNGEQVVTAAPADMEAAITRQIDSLLEDDE